MKRIEMNDSRFEYPFVAYMPEEFTENLPLVIQLHGGGEKGNGGEDLILVERHGFSSILKEKDFPCIVVMPQCPKEEIWLIQVKLIKKFIEQMQDEYKADKNRTVVAGISMGAYATWYLATTYPDMFAAIAPCCGGGMPIYAPALTMPIWAFHGSDDDVVHPMESIHMINRIRKLGINKNVKFTMFDGVMHDSWKYAFNAELLNWLLEHKK